MTVEERIAKLGICREAAPAIVVVVNGKLPLPIVLDVAHGVLKFLEAK